MKTHDISPQVTGECRQDWQDCAHHRQRSHDAGSCSIIIRSPSTSPANLRNEMTESASDKNKPSMMKKASHIGRKIHLLGNKLRFIIRHSIGELNRRDKRKQATSCSLSIRTEKANSALKTYEKIN
jgi:hypothetical protein